MRTIHSMRFKIFAFLAVLLVTMLLLVNIYPVISARDTAFREKESAIKKQASTFSSSLAKLDRPDYDSISEVLRLLDIRGFDRSVVIDGDGAIVYDSAGSAGEECRSEDMSAALSGKVVFRSQYSGDAFISSCAMPVSSQGKLTGAVYMVEHDTDRAQIILALQRQVRSISLTIASVTLLMAAVYFSLFLRRVQALAGSMRIVAGGNYKYRMDVTGQDELSELGKEFNALTERLDDNEQQRRRFVSDASHELKTPLASIRLLSDSIVQSDHMDVETMLEFVTDIGHEAERLQRTTEKLLDLSRLDDDIQVIPEPVDVKQVSIDALVLLRPLAAECKVRIRCDLEDGCVVMATVDDMFHIIFNLMENAIKYNLPDGSVHLTLRGSEESICLTVEDTGIGIPEEDTYNIFNRFYRVDKARSREAGGSGLGLSIVHDAVKAHKGTITVGPNQPRGSRFIVTFPRPSAEETGI